MEHICVKCGLPTAIGMHDGKWYCFRCAEKLQVALINGWKPELWPSIAPLALPDGWETRLSNWLFQALSDTDHSDPDTTK